MVDLFLIGFGVEISGDFSLILFFVVLFLFFVEECVEIGEFED